MCVELIAAIPMMDGSNLKLGCGEMTLIAKGGEWEENGLCGLRGLKGESGPEKYRKKRGRAAYA